MSTVRAGQLETTGGPHNSLRSHLLAALVYTYIAGGRGGWYNDLEGRHLQSIILKVPFNDKAGGLTKLGKTQRMFGLLCAVLKVTGYSLYTYCVPIKLPYYVL